VPIYASARRALAVACDVRRVEHLKTALHRTIETFGRLDVAFINNAGVEQEPAGTPELAEEEWEPDR